MPNDDRTVASTPCSASSEGMRELRGQSHELDAVDRGAAQGPETTGDAERSAPQVHVGAGRLREVRAGQGAAGKADPHQLGRAEVRVAQQLLAS